MFPPLTLGLFPLSQGLKLNLKLTMRLAGNFLGSAYLCPPPPPMGYKHMAIFFNMVLGIQTQVLKSIVQLFLATEPSPQAHTVELQDGSESLGLPCGSLHLEDGWDGSASILPDIPTHHPSSPIGIGHL